MRKKVDITPLPEYHKSLEGGFIGAGLSALTSYITLYFATKNNLPNLYMVFLTSIFGLLISSRHIYVNFNNALVELRKPNEQNPHLAHDKEIFKELKSYLDFEQMELVKNRDFAGLHDIDDFEKVMEYVHYFSDVNKNFMTHDLIIDAGELYDSARNFIDRFRHYNSPNSSISGPERIMVDISKKLRDGKPEERERYYREVAELSQLANLFHSRYEAFINKANMVLKSA